MAYLSNRQAPLCGADPFGLESLQSAASLAEDEWKRILLDQIDSLHRLRARRAVPVRWIMEIRSLLTPAFQNSTRALQYHKSRRDMIWHNNQFYDDWPVDDWPVKWL